MIFLKFSLYFNFYLYYLLFHHFKYKALIYNQRKSIEIKVLIIGNYFGQILWNYLVLAKRNS